MAKVKFIATTLTRKGRFGRGDEIEFPTDEAKDLQRLSSVESPTPPVKKVAKKAPKKKVVKDEPKDIS